MSIIRGFVPLVKRKQWVSFSDVFLADVVQAAALAVRFPGGAGGTAVEHAAVAEVVGLFRRQELAERELHLLRVFGVDEPDAVGDANGVGVRDHRARHAVDVSGDEVRGLPADALQGSELLDGRRHFPVEAVKDLVCHDDEVPRFRAEETGGADEFFDVFDICRGHLDRRRVFFKQCRRDQVHPGVRALGGQANRDQQLVRVLIGEGAKVVRELRFQ